MKESLFDKTAHRYDKILPYHITQHYLNKRVSFIKNVIKKGKILDVGCGTGLLLATLKDLEYKVTGLDFSLSMIQEMKNKARGVAICGTSEFLPFKSGSFDLALTIVTLHHIGDKQRIARTISEMVRVAKADGKILIWAHNPNNPYWPIIMKKVPWDRDVNRLIPLKEIEDNLKARGIRKIEVYRKGFIPDFIPKIFMPLVKVIEICLEQAPGIRDISAHNVVVGHK